MAKEIDLFLLCVIVILTSGKQIESRLIGEFDWPEPRKDLHRFPNAFDCSLYYAVKADGSRVTKECPSDELFDYRTLRCRQKTAAKCWSDILKRDKLKKKGNHFQCPSRWGVFPDFEDCSLFYDCMGGVPYPRKCPDNFLFDNAERNCVEAKDAICADNKDIVEPDYKCPYAWGVFAYSKDCSKYYECVKKVPSLRTCKKNMLFDNFNRRCYPVDIVECGDRFNPYEHLLSQWVTHHLSKGRQGGTTERSFTRNEWGTSKRTSTERPGEIPNPFSIRRPWGTTNLFPSENPWKRIKRFFTERPTNVTTNHFSTERRWETTNRFSTGRPWETTNRFSTGRPWETTNRFSTGHSLKTSNEFSTRHPYETTNLYSTRRPWVTTNHFSTERPWETTNRFYTGRPWETTNRFYTGRPWETSNEFSTSHPGETTNRYSTRRPRETTNRFSKGLPWETTNRFSTERPWETKHHFSTEHLRLTTERNPSDSELASTYHIPSGGQGETN